MKKVLALVMAAAMVLCLAACGGLDVNKIKGDWTTSTINGQTVADYAAANGLDPVMAASNMTVADDGKTAKFANALMADTYDITVKANGFEVLNADKTILMSITYSDADKTLSYKAAGADGVEYTYVLVKGTTDLTVTTAAEEVADETAPAEEEVADETAPAEEVVDETAGEEAPAEEEVAGEEAPVEEDLEATDAE